MRKTFFETVTGPLLVLGVLGGIVALLWWSWTWSGRFMAPIHAGMTMADVRSRLGQARAVRKHTDGTESWDYRHWWSSDARVDFGTNGVVISLDID